jgi:uncharacterized protein YndB with AHSA1/START domain
MKKANALSVTTPSEREIRVVREFDAPRRLVWDAYTKPALLKQWLFGPDGWALEVCEIDLRIGGRYRYVWRRASTGATMGMGGEIREVVAQQKLVSTERFDDAWYPGEAVGSVELAEASGRTTLTQTLLYESREARDIALRSGMEAGLGAGYDRLDAILAAMRERAE